MSTMDKVKNALHLNKEHDPASTTHHHNAATQNTSTSAGPHSSNLANKVDPTVDSDLDGSRNMGATSGTRTEGYSGTGYGTNTGTTTGAAGYGTSGSTTAGPHSSNMANKLDPTVDSDLDGSRNLGATSNQRTAGYSGTNAGNNIGSATHQGTTHQLDAAQVPPSVFVAHRGEPEILHGDKTHDRAKRHSVVSHQDQLSGV